MTSAAAEKDPVAPPASFLGQPLPAWLFGLRTWASMIVALYAAFWLQLGDPSSSAVTVAILALPKRGQAIQKALFRIGATLVGFVASIAITGLFSQSRDVFIAVVALWIGGAVFVSSLYDGTRAYGLVLSGYTVAIISVLQIDTPQRVFETGISRVAVVTLGIVSVALISDTFAAPELWPDVRARMREVAGDVEVSVEHLLAGSPTRPERLRAILAALSGLRLDILALPSERAEGWRQSAAGQSALAAMVATTSAARVVSLMRRLLPVAEVDAAVAGKDDPAATSSGVAAAAMTGDRRRIALALYVSDVAEQRELFRREMAAMEEGRPAERSIHLPIHRERKEAARKGLRVFLAIAAAAPVFILSSWPMTSLAFGQFATLAALSATQPSAKAFASGAVIAMPLVTVLVGITEFLILDGVDSFPLLALGMAPGVFLACFLMVRPRTAGIGFLTLVYLVVLLSPSNPQSYNPQSYVLSSILTIAAAFALAVALNCFVPTSDRERRRWMVERLRDDLLDAAEGRTRRDPAAAGWLAAGRLVQGGKFAIGSEAAREPRLRYMLLLCHLIRAANSAQIALDEVDDRDLREAARRALSTVRPEPIAEAADRLAADGARDPRSEHASTARLRAVAAMSFMSDALADRASELRHLRRALVP